MMKRNILLTLILLASLYTVFAGPVTEQGSWTMGHSTVNNANSAWDVSLEQHLDDNMTLSPGDSGFPKATFVATPEDSLGLVRVRNAYKNSIRVDISPGANGWYFVHDDNPTVTRPFKIDVYKLGWSINDDVYTNTSKTRVGRYPSSPSSTTTETLTLDGATWSGIWIFLQSCKTFYEYEILLYLPRLDAGTYLEPGEYSASFSVSLDGGAAETFTIKGYYGIENSNTTDYSFYVQSTGSTYNVNLEDTATWVDVATLHFGCTEVVSSNSDPSTDNSRKNKFKVYISPYSDIALDAGSSSSDLVYRFIKTNSEYQTRTEINTVYYDLAYSGSGASYTSMALSNHPHVYVLPVGVSAQAVGGGYGGQKDWLVTYALSNTYGTVYIKLKSLSSTTEHQRGTYYSNLYFFVNVT